MSARFHRMCALLLLISATNAWSNSQATNHRVQKPLRITEILQNPRAVSDADGEWFEVFNAGPEVVHLQGWQITDDRSDRHIISDGLTVQPHAFAVLCRSADQKRNGGVECDYEYGNRVSLSNGSDAINLIDTEGVTVVRVRYDGGPDYPNPNGASMVYTGVGSASSLQPSGRAWGVSRYREPGFAGSDGDLGSPGTNGVQQNLVTTPRTGLFLDKNRLQVHEQDGQASVTLQISRPYPSVPTEVDLIPVGGTAVNGVDFETVSAKTLAFQDREEVVLTFYVINDNLTECGEAFTFELSNVIGGYRAGIIGDPTIVLEILDDECHPPNLVISEFMHQPSFGKSSGEWIEVFNPGPDTVRTDGWYLADEDHERVVLPAGIEIPPGGFNVWCRTDDPAVLDGLLCDAVYGKRFTLSDLEDELVILLPDGLTPVDRVTYGPEARYYFPGRSRVYTGRTWDDNGNRDLWIHAPSRESGYPVPGVHRGSPGKNGAAQNVHEKPAATIYFGSTTLLVDETDTPFFLRILVQEGGLIPDGYRPEYKIISGANPPIVAMGIAEPSSENDGFLVPFTFTDDTEWKEDAFLDILLVPPDPNSTVQIGRPSRVRVVIRDNDAPPVWITEYLANPAAVPDSDGEWIELFNAGDVSLDLKGWILTSEKNERYVFRESLPIEAGAFVVLCRNVDEAENGGLPCDHSYDGLTLGNTSDTLELRFPDGRMVSTIDWRSERDNVPKSGRSSYFTGSSRTHQNTAASWSPSSFRLPGYSNPDGDFGSPGTFGEWTFSNRYPVSANRTPERSVGLTLNGVYPNPFNPSTIIQFVSDRSQPLRIEVFSLLGRRVADVFDGEIPEGIFSVQFDARHLPSGVYYLRAVGEVYLETRKLVLLK